MCYKLETVEIDDSRIWNLNSLRMQIIFYWVLVQWSPAFLAPGTGFMEDKIFPQTWAGDGFRMVQAQYIYCALFSCYGYISSTSDHQALDPGGWGPLFLVFIFLEPSKCPGIYRWPISELSWIESNWIDGISLV